MRYFLYPLRFSAPVHFGTAECGGGLEHTRFTLPADTFFSALLSELYHAKENAYADTLLQKVEAGHLRCSDLLPWREAATGEWCFYLPRPILPMMQAADTDSVSLSYRAACEETAAWKQQKRLAYIRASRMTEYLANVRAGRPFLSEDSFGQEVLRQRVNCREIEALPYFVASFTFAESAGLYLLLAAEQAEDADFFADILTFVGHSGLGGKRSSGYGKFQLADDCLELDGAGIYGADDAALYTLLTQEQASWQMALSSVLPAEEDLLAVCRGNYHLRRVGGFVTDAAVPGKKDSICLLESGSCFQQRIPGQMTNLGTYDGHPILRYGYGLYAGISG